MSDRAPRSRQGKRRRDAGKAAAAAAPAPESKRPEPVRAPPKPGWTVPHPEELPKPTYWPAALAFAVTFMLWGIVTTPIIAAVGVLLLVVSLSGWIGDIRNERAH